MIKFNRDKLKKAGLNGMKDSELLEVLKNKIDYLLTLPIKI